MTPVMGEETIDTMMVTSGVTIPASILVFALGVIVTLIGIVFKSLRDRLRSVEDETDKNGDQLSSVSESLYGEEKDSNDNGYAGRINNVEGQVADLQETVDDPSED